MTWLDKRAEKQAEKIFRERGLKVSAKDPVSKILWLKENRPEIFKSTYKFVDCSGYLIMKLTGRYAWPEESAITYGYDPEKGKWKFVDYGLFPETLPEIVNANAKVAELSQNASEILGLPKEIPVFAGGSDVTVAYVGSGAIKPGSVHIYLGSSSWVCLVTKERLKSKKFHLFYSRPFGYWLNIGESESACLSLEWFRKIIFENSLKNISKQYAIITKMASKVTVGSDNLLFIPWMQGERAPISDDFARGLLFGLKLNHTKGHIFRSVMEGVAYNCRWIFEELLELYKIRKVKVIRAVGGGFLNELWCKIFADVFGLEIQVVGNPQFTGATGAALIAALGQGSYKQIEDLHLLIPASYLKRPTNKNKRIYDHLFKVFRELYWERINKIYKKLASFET
jgi:xylulokinase